MLAKQFEEIMDRLNIFPGDVLFVHSSWDRLRFLDLSPLEIIDRLKKRVGERGLLCMPTYPWLYPMSLFDPQKIFCPSTTPSAVGFLTEIFRRCPDVYRSANPFLPVAAYGSRAYELVSGQENVKDLFGNESVFGQLLKLKAKQLGLGVSVGLSTFIHMADWKLRDLKNFKIGEEVIVSTLNLKDHLLKNVPFLIIPETILKVVNSSILFEKREDLMSQINFKTVEGNFFYSYYIHNMLKIAFEEAENALRTNDMPCWYIQKPSDNTVKKGI